MITAAEALEKTKEVHLSRIESFILAAIEKGEYKCEILPSQQFISAENKKILEDNGFKVIVKESMLGKEMLINWEQNA